MIEPERPSRCRPPVAWREALPALELGERGSVAVAIGEHDLGYRDRQLQPDRRIERVEDSLVLGPVDVGHHVAQGREVFECEEGVPDSFGDPDRSMAHGVELHRVDDAEGRGTDAEIDDEVERASAEHGDVLGLTPRRHREVDSSEDAARRHRCVPLSELESAPHRHLERILPEQLDEVPSIVGVDGGLEDDASADGQLAMIHPVSLATADGRPSLER
ncbi:hypothetical protein OVN20_00215 [Microcella daejeonensis]|nr:hypothetical protein [Microcella daejeonensis]WAB84045.1 hypothetical protein OVN20_00215 [Microcella daejeonensis]